MKRLSPIDKIKYLRKKYKITQKDLADGIFSRPYLAMLEKEKKNLTEGNVIDIITRFNDIFKAKGINREVTYEWLMEKRIKQEINHTSIYREKLDQINDEFSLLELANEVKNSIDISLKNSEEIIFYYDMGNKLFEYNHITLAINFLYSSLSGLAFLEDYKRLEDSLSKSLNYILKIEDFDGCIFIYNQFKKHFISFNPKALVDIYIIILESYFKINQIESFRQIYKILQKSELSREQYFKVAILNLERLILTNRYLDGLNLLKEVETIYYATHKFLIDTYFLQLYIKLEYKSVAITYQDKLEKILDENIDDNNYFKALYLLYNIAHIDKNFDKKILYLNKINSLNLDKYDLKIESNYIFKILDFCCNELERFASDELNLIYSIYSKVKKYDDFKFTIRFSLKLSKGENPYFDDILSRLMVSSSQINI